MAGTVTRRCGSCTLCCKLLPVTDLDKPAGHRCAHQRMGKGCAIYARRPMACRLWDCVWLGGDNDGLRRPDLVHYVIDPAPDYVTAVPDDGGERVTIPVVQVWVDPKFPDAHRDPGLRAYLEKRSAEGFAAVIRYDDVDAFVLFPPAMTGQGWVENQGTSVRGEGHNAEDIARALTAATGEDYVLAYGQQAVQRLGRLLK